MILNVQKYPWHLHSSGNSEGSMHAFYHGSVRVAFIAQWSQDLLQSQQKQSLIEQGLGI